MNIISLLAVSMSITGAGFDSSRPAPLTGSKQVQEIKVEGKADSGKINIEIKHGTIGDILAEISKQTKLNFLSDAYSDEGRIPISLKNVSTKNAISIIAQLFQRDVVVVGNIFVFRSVKGAGRVAEELSHRSQYPCDWPDAGTITVDKSKSLNRPVVPILSLKASRISMTQAVQSVGKEVGWKVRVDPELGQRRFYAEMTDTTPGQFTEALTVLLQGNQQVTLTQTPEQKAADLKAAEEALDHRADREKESAKIRGDLEKLLSPEQFDKLAKGSEVPLSLKNLPPALRQRTEAYIKFLCDQKSSLLSCDLSRIGEFEIVFLPLAAAPGGSLGVNGFLQGGGQVGF